MSIKKEEPPVILPAQGLSPRMKWMAKHGVVTRPIAGGRFEAQMFGGYSTGKTEIDAIANMVIKYNNGTANKIHLWNEEEYVEAMAAKSTSIISKS